jgi:hypothetical protein
VKALPNHEAEGHQGEHGNNHQADANDHPLGVKRRPKFGTCSFCDRTSHELILQIGPCGTQNLTVLLYGTTVHMKAQSALGGNALQVSIVALRGFPCREFSSYKSRNRLSWSPVQSLQFDSSFFYEERCSFEWETDMISLKRLNRHKTVIFVRAFNF